MLSVRMFNKDDPIYEISYESDFGISKDRKKNSKNK